MLEGLQRTVEEVLVLREVGPEVEVSGMADPTGNGSGPQVSLASRFTEQRAEPRTHSQYSSEPASTHTANSCPTG